MQNWQIPKRNCVLGGVVCAAGLTQARRNFAARAADINKKLDTVSGAHPSDRGPNENKTKKQWINGKGSRKSFYTAIPQKGEKRKKQTKKEKKIERLN